MVGWVLCRSKGPGERRLREFSSNAMQSSRRGETVKRSILFMTVVSCVFMIAAATAVLVSREDSDRSHRWRRE